MSLLLGEQPGNNSTVYPVGLAFCGSSVIAHQVTLTGSRTLCCGKGENIQCIAEFRVKNSLGNKYEGWFQARPLITCPIAGKNAYGSYLTQIRPCSGSVPCSPFILSAPIPSDFGGQWNEFSATLPAQYLILARDHNALQALLKREDADRFLIEKNQQVNSAAIVAATDGNIQALEIISKIMPEVTCS